MKEIWKDIAGYEGKYQVSNRGRVRSLEYHNMRGIKRIGFLRPTVVGRGIGYLRVALSRKHKLTSFMIHRLVALAFIENPHNLPQVNHKDGNKHNNNVDNLEWCTNSYNQLHAYANGLNPHHFTKFHPVIVINKETNEIMRFECVKYAAEYMGINKLTLQSRLRNGFKPRRETKYTCCYEKDYNYG